jgi:hypothetical protein
MNVNDATGVVAAVETEMQIELRRGPQVAADLTAIELNDGHVLGVQLSQDGTGRRNRHELSGPLGDIAGRPNHETRGGELAGRRRDTLTLISQ